MPLAKPSKSSAPPPSLSLEKGDVAMPLGLKSASGLAGEAASPQALARLNAALTELRAMQVQPLLHRAVAALQANDAKKGGELALKALEMDETNGYAWYLLAIARECSSDFKSSLECYDAALKLMPNQADVANDLGRLAARLDMPQVAESLFRLFLKEHPDNLETHNNLACVVRDQNRSDEAIEILRGAIMASPTTGLLWNTLGTVLSERGDTQDSLPFFDEAVRLAPGDCKARYNRSIARLALSDYAGALEDSETALQGNMAEHERAMMRLARATLQVAMGNLADGWDGYEERLSPHYADTTHFLIDRPQWRPADDLTGKSLLLMGEQGLGDEVLFANVIPDLIDALGVDGKLRIAVQQRLIPLFQRSFPQAEVGAHNTLSVDGHTVRGAPFVTDLESVDLWAPMASLLRRFRRRAEDFPARERFMIADPMRIEHWRKVLAEGPPGRKVGILWKSLKVTGPRARHFSPFERWRPVLQTPGVTFVNLQYGECAVELERARQELGVDIWQPPGIDLKDELDEVAALTCALDLVLGPANATTNIAAACGAPVWLIGTPGSWTMLGTDHYPWYPQVRVFQPPAFNTWDPVMEEVAEALAAGA
jgi:tetratricopeptide (TPR) repeat protein